MNERIKELALEADKLWDGASPEDSEWCEKFAELIVKECAKIADDNFNKGFCPVGDYIKQHFGV
jgi:hypothetical protein